MRRSRCPVRGHERDAIRLFHSPMCHVFKVAASGYYAWLKRPCSKRAQEEERLQVEIKAAHKRTRGTYGSERLKTDLAEHGVKVGVHRIKRIRKALGIRCKQKKKFKATTDSTHTLPVADNLLDRKFTASEPRQAWVSDITYVATDEGWLYCAAHKDLFNGEIVGYALGARMTRGSSASRFFGQLPRIIRLKVSSIIRTGAASIAVPNTRSCSSSSA